MSEFWAFAPLIFLVIGTVILVVRGFWPKGRLEKIKGHAYKKEIVVLDGKFFHECTFEEVTFRYQGQPFNFVNCSVNGATRLETQNQAVFGTIAMLKFLQFLNQDFATSWNPALPKEYFDEK